MGNFSAAFTGLYHNRWGTLCVTFLEGNALRANWQAVRKGTWPWNEGSHPLCETPAHLIRTCVLAYVRGSGTQSLGEAR